MDDSIPKKRCGNKECDKLLPATTEYFFSSKTHADGLVSRCKQCRYAQKKANRERKKNEVPLPDGHKRCNKCKEVFPATLEYFHAHAGHADGLNSHCKPCKLEGDVKYREENREVMNQKSREHWAQNADTINAERRKKYAENPEPFLLACKVYRETQPEKVKANKRASYKRNQPAIRERFNKKYWENPEKYRAENRECYKRHPIGYKQRRDKRRVIEAETEGYFTKSDIEGLYEQQNGRCHWCGEPLEGHYEIDHRIPLSKGGTSWPSNLVLAHRRCNRSKYNKMPWEFMEGRLL